jgi:hypothetical protein
MISPLVESDLRTTRIGEMQSLSSRLKSRYPQGVQGNRKSICAKLYSQLLGDGKNKRKIS